MKITPNLGLRKPDQEDFYNVDDFNYNADVIDQEMVKRIINSGGVPSIQAGLDASKPTPGTAGRIYVATDTQIIYVDTGSAWQKIGIANWGDIIGKPSAFPPTAHKSTHAAGGSDPLTPADIGAIPTSEKGAANGVAELDGAGLIPLSRIPTSAFASAITSNKIINVPGDYPTIQAALDSLKQTWIPRDVTVTIQVAAGTYTHTSPIIIDHPCGLCINIVGATPVTTTITSAGSITGSVGNWNVQINVQSTTGISAGDYVIIRDTTGTGDHYAHRGIWKVVSVNSATQITVQNTHRKSTFPTAALSGGMVVALKTILKFTGCDGIRVIPGSILGYLDNIAIVGDGSRPYSGIVVGTKQQDNNNGLAVAFCGGNFGVSSFGDNGVIARLGGSFNALGGAAFCSNGVHGAKTETGGLLYVINTIANGNGWGGFNSDARGMIATDNSTASGNGNAGFASNWGSSMSANNSVATSNVNYGFSSTLNSAIYAPYTTAFQNANADYRAINVSTIYMGGYTGSPTSSPTLDTLGNNGSIVTSTTF